MAGYCDISYCAICAEAILQRVRDVRRQFGPVRKAKDIEAVHKMRVASRRLRAALAMFEPCLPLPTRRWRKKVRKVTRALGTARDLDVQIAAVKSLQRGARPASWRPGLECLLDSLRGRRRSAQSKVGKVLSHMKASRILEEMEHALGKLAKARPAGREELAKTYRLAEETIIPLLDDLESYEPDLARPRAIARHHAMRIAAKHLRYSLEVFEPLYGRSLRPALRSAKEMQTLLGELHDCDVWAAMLPEFLAGDIATAAKDAEKIDLLARGIKAFRRDRLRRRRTVYRQCLRYWRQSTKEKTWPELRKTLKQAGGR